jgi:hypothetical protein
MVEQRCSLVEARKQKKRERKGLGSQYSLQGRASNGLLPPMRPHLLKVPLPLNNTISWKPSLQYISFWGRYIEDPNHAPELGISELHPRVSVVKVLVYHLPTMSP